MCVNKLSGHLRVCCDAWIGEWWRVWGASVKCHVSPPHPPSSGVCKREWMEGEIWHCHGYWYYKVYFLGGCPVLGWSWCTRWWVNFPILKMYDFRCVMLLCWLMIVETEHMVTACTWTHTEIRLIKLIYSMNIHFPHEKTTPVSLQFYLIHNTIAQD